MRKLYTVYEFRSPDSTPVAITSFEDVGDANVFLSWFKCDEYQYIITSTPMFSTQLGNSNELYIEGLR